ncbi:hypothetical protein AACH06_00830 [Ideonella sp. DXS29W]|uniref:Uncharacterized protein n=1 Tax=Ideonella lacteola TaxID=2984193 RepID=A0ABU9BHD2_9BURK
MSGSIGPSMGAMNSGAASSAGVDSAGMQAVSAQNAQSIDSIMTQGQLSALRSYAEATAKTLKAGADAVKGLV